MKKAFVILTVTCASALAFAAPKKAAKIPPSKSSQAPTQTQAPIAAPAPTFETKVTTQSPPTHQPLGIYAGLDYMNLTDTHQTIYWNENPQYEREHNEYGSSTGLAGLRLGYNHTPESGFGYEGGLRFLKGLNKNETGDINLNIIIPEVNAKWALNRWILGYIGINASFITGFDEASRFNGGLGGQIGLGTRFTREIALNAGYTVLTQTLKSKSSSETVDKIDYQISGFSANVTYTF